MFYSSNTRISLLITAGLLAATSCSDGRSVTNASPRVTDVPLQATAGGTMFSLDLKDYVEDRESADASLTYSVSSGGGSFAGSVYSNTFDTMGEYDVTFAVADGAKTETGAFRVRVNSANFAVVQEDSSGLLLLDTKTEKQLRVAGATATPSLATGLASGLLVYQVAAGSGQAAVGLRSADSRELSCRDGCDRQRDLSGQDQRRQAGLHDRHRQHPGAVLLQPGDGRFRGRLHRVCSAR